MDFIAGVAAFAVYMALDIAMLSNVGIYEDIASFALGLVLGILLLGMLHTSRHMSKVQAAKRRLIQKMGKIKQ